MRLSFSFADNNEFGFAREVADYILLIEQGETIKHGPAAILANP